MRVRTGVVRRKRHNKIRREATKRGFSGHRGRTFRGAKEGLLQALKHSYIGRKLKKRTMRRLWITRLNAATQQNGLSYSAFAHLLNDSPLELDRKVLSTIAMHDPETFNKIVAKVSK